MNKRLKALILGNSIFILGGSLLVPVYALFSQSIGAGIELAGLLFAAKFIANAVADIIVILIHEKVSLAEHMYRGSMFIRGLGWVYLGIFPSVHNLLLIQVVTGFAEGFGTPSFSSLMADSLDKGKHVREWAQWDLIKTPLIAISGAASGFIIAQWGFATMFYMMGGLAILGSMVPIASKAKAERKRKI